MKLFNYSNDIVGVIVKNGNLTTARGPLDYLFFCEKKTMKIILKTFIYAYFRNNNFESFSSKNLYLYTKFIIQAGLIRENRVIDLLIRPSIYAYKFIKLNENEICVYLKNNEGGKLCIYEFE